MELSNIHRYLSGEATPEERKALERWLNESEKNQRTFDGFKEIYDVDIKHSYRFDKEKALYRFREVMLEEREERSKLPVSQPVKRLHNRTQLWWKVAAVLLVAIGLSLYVFTNPGIIQTDETAKEISGTFISTEAGEQKSFRLQDGSRIRLNAESEIFIPESFGKESRNISLKGEAFFEVAYTNGAVFEVETKTARIEVLGTSFGVRAWQSRQESVIAVQSGRVSVRSSDEAIVKTTILEPGEYSRVEAGTPPTPPISGNLEQFTGWTQQVFVFDETPLKDVLKQLELHFNVSIQVSDSSSLNDPVTARYREETLGEILEYTSITHSLNFTIGSTPNLKQ